MTLQEQVAELEKLTAEMRRMIDGFMALGRTLERMAAASNKQSKLGV